MLDYIEYNGKAFYLIEKKNLPEEIRESLVGGDAGNGEYTDYVSLNDVYGVNSDLKVYYCSGGLDSIQNLGKDDVDDAVERDVFTDLESDGLGKLLSQYDSSKDGKIQSSEISSITQLEVTENIDLSDIYNLYSLEKLIIKEVQNVNLSGIENCMKLNYIWFYNSPAVSYEPVGKLGGKLTQLYFSHINDTYLEKVCEDIKNYDLSGLTHLGIFGGTGNFNSGPEKYLGVTDRNINFGQRVDEVTTLDPLSKIKNQLSIKYLWIRSCKITNLNGIKDFTNLIYLNSYGNSLNDINGLEKLTNIEYLRLANNSFNDEATKQNDNRDSLYVLQKLTKLFWLDIATNSGIKYISYLSELTQLKYLYMDGCGNLFDEDVIGMNSFINGMTDKTFDPKYSGKLVDTKNQTYLSYYNQQIDISEFKLIGQCKKLTQLNLRNTKVVKKSSETLGENENTVEKLMNNVFQNLTLLKHLTINGLTIDIDGTNKKISDLSFLPSTIVILDVRNTDVIAKGDTSEDSVPLDSLTNQLSIKNSEKLNSLQKIDSFIINTDKFDFSRLQTMVNRLGQTKSSTDFDKDFLGSTSTNYGLACYNWDSFETLEKCDEITNIYCEFHIGWISIGGDRVLDLSNCNKLTFMWCYPWNGLTVKFPNCMKKIYERACNFEFDFELPEPGKKIELDIVQLDEVNSSRISTQLNVLKKHNVNIDTLELTAILPGGNSFVNNFLTDGTCNWIRKIYYFTAGWYTNSWDWKVFYSDLNLLKDSMIEEIVCASCPETSLDFIKELKSLKKLTITNSKIVDISALTPVYGDDGTYVSGLPNLEEFTINNSITNIASVGSLTKLKRLDVSGNQINNGIEALAGLEKLEYINLTNCNALAQNRKICQFSRLYWNR